MCMYVCMSADQGNSACFDITDSDKQVNQTWHECNSIFDKYVLNSKPVTMAMIGRFVSCDYNYCKYYYDWLV